MTDTFYNIQSCNLKKRRAIIYEAYENSHEWWVDKLEGGDIARKGILMTFEDVMKKFDSSCHFVVIHRTKDNYGEIGFSTMLGDPDYFLFIHITTEKLKKLVSWYNLKPM